MLAKNNRLAKSDFKKIWQRAKTLKGRLFLIKYQPNNLDKSRSRFGIIVSKKNINKATSRNKIKRRIRYIIQTYSRKSTLNYDVIILTNKSVADSIFLDLKNELAQMLDQIYK